MNLIYLPTTYFYKELHSVSQQFVTDGIAYLENTRYLIAIPELQPVMPVWE